MFVPHFTGMPEVFIHWLCSNFSYRVQNYVHLLFHLVYVVLSHHIYILLNVGNVASHTKDIS